MKEKIEELIFNENCWKDFAIIYPVLLNNVRQNYNSQNPQKEKSKLRILDYLNPNLNKD